MAPTLHLWLHCLPKVASILSLDPCCSRTLPFSIKTWSLFTLLGAWAGLWLLQIIDEGRHDAGWLSKLGHSKRLMLPPVSSLGNANAAPPRDFMERPRWRGTEACSQQWASTPKYISHKNSDYPSFQPSGLPAKAPEIMEQRQAISTVSCPNRWPPPKFLNVTHGCLIPWIYGVIGYATLNNQNDYHGLFFSPPLLPYHLLLWHFPSPGLFYTNPQYPLSN